MDYLGRVEVAGGSFEIEDIFDLTDMGDAVAEGAFCVCPFCGHRFGTVESSTDHCPSCDTTCRVEGVTLAVEAEVEGEEFDVDLTPVFYDWDND